MDFLIIRSTRQRKWKLTWKTLPTIYSLFVAQPSDCVGPPIASNDPGLRIFSTPKSASNVA